MAGEVKQEIGISGVTLLEKPRPTPGCRATRRRRSMRHIPSEPNCKRVGRCHVAIGLQKVEEDLKIVGVDDWRGKARDRNTRCNITREAKAHTEL